jgi:hypothetical protein
MARAARSQLQQRGDLRYDLAPATGIWQRRSCSMTIRSRPHNLSPTLKSIFPTVSDLCLMRLSRQRRRQGRESATGNCIIFAYNSLQHDSALLSRVSSMPRKLGIQPRKLLFPNLSKDLPGSTAQPEPVESRSSPITELRFSDRESKSPLLNLQYTERNV